MTRLAKEHFHQVAIGSNRMAVTVELQGSEPVFLDAKKGLREGRGW